MNKKIELERCPICGKEVDFVSFPPPLPRRYRNGNYCIMCNSCQMLFGWDRDYGCQYDTEKEAAKEWNAGQAFKYRRMWEELCITLLGLKERVNHCAISKKDLIIGIKATMENIEEEAFREAAEDGEQ